MGGFCGSPGGLKSFIMLFVLLFGLLVGMSEAIREERKEDDEALLELYSSRDDMVEIAGYGEDKLSTVVITGTLLCGACIGHQEDHHRNHPGLPISGAVVSATCHAKGVKKLTRARGVTDEYGDFIIDLPSNLHAIPDLHTKCSVQALQLPNSSPCRRSHRKRHREITRIRLSSVGNGIRTYTAGTIRLMPKHA